MYIVTTNKVKKLAELVTRCSTLVSFKECTF